MIRLDKGRHLTPSTFDSSPSRTPSPEALFQDMTITYLQYFDVFIHRNNFTGRDVSFLTGVQGLIKAGRGHLEPDSYLLNAMLALGAMQAHSLGALQPLACLRFALEAYMRSIAQLRSAVAASSSETRTGILWSTFFLGLYEVRRNY